MDMNELRNKLEKENKQLKERIDKAIEEIEINISILSDSIERIEKIDRMAALSKIGVRNVFYGIKSTLKGENNEK